MALYQIQPKLKVMGYATWKLSGKLHPVEAQAETEHGMMGPGGAPLVVTLVAESECGRL